MKTIKKIVKELDTNLDFLETEIENVLRQSEEGSQITHKAIEQIRESFFKLKSLSTNDEIYFFKVLKPYVFSKLIYYVTLRPLICCTAI